MLCTELRVTTFQWRKYDNDDDDDDDQLLVQYYADAAVTTYPYAKSDKIWVILSLLGLTRLAFIWFKNNLLHYKLRINIGKTKSIETCWTVETNQRKKTSHADLNAKEGVLLSNRYQ